MGYSHLTIEASLLNEKLQAKLTKILKTSTQPLMIAYFQDQLQNVISDIDSVMHDDAILKMMLLTLVHESKFKGFDQVLTREEFNKNQKSLANYLLEDIDGINYLITEFNFDKCLDLLSLIPKEQLNASHFETILALLKESRSRKRTFYDGRRPSYDDVQLIINRIEHIKAAKKKQIDDASLQSMREITRLILQKAITESNTL